MGERTFHFESWEVSSISCPRRTTVGNGLLQLASRDRPRVVPGCRPDEERPNRLLVISTLDRPIGANGAMSCPTVVRLGQEMDETSSSRSGMCRSPITSSTGATDVPRMVANVSVQPMILPLFGAWSELDLLAKIAGLAKPQGRS